jgi:hypothetical protein
MGCVGAKALDGLFLHAPRIVPDTGSVGLIVAIAVVVTAVAGLGDGFLMALFPRVDSLLLHRISWSPPVKTMS